MRREKRLQMLEGLTSISHGRIRHVKKQVLRWRKRMKAMREASGEAEKEREQRVPAVKRDFFGSDEGET